MIPGHATPEGTARYAERFAVATDHFRTLEPAGRLSSLGVGTYLGRADAATDTQYRRALSRALQRGLNVVDTAINYRNQRSERTVGAVLADAVARGSIRREEVVVATKGGYLPLDAEADDPRGHFTRTYLESGLVGPGDVVGGAHCMAPRYLADQIERSRANLGVETIDVYYLHNPESQLEEVDRPDFEQRLRAAFAALEEAVDAGRIGCYGAATWNGFRQPPDAPDHLSLPAMVAAARDAGGADHHFKVIQLPYNLGMPEAYARTTQRVGDEMLSVLDAAQRLGVYVMASASVHQGQLTRNLPDVLAQYIPGLQTDAQRALQFVRSTPGIGTALVGMKSTDHVEENSAVAAVEAMPPEIFARLFTRA
jgi:aryl-alcohol dehydrogenase-like predicted oxidoreductase